MTRLPRQGSISQHVTLTLAVLLACVGFLFLTQPAHAQEPPSTLPTINFCSRTAEVQDAVLAAFPGSTCATITDTHLASLSQLSVTGYSSVGIVPGDFAGLTGLQVLTIRESPSLTTVPANAFSGLTSPNFISLDISNNDLTALPEDVFDGLTNLRILYLGSNGLTTLPEDVFDGLTKLTFLRLDDNGLTALPEDVFDGLTNLTTIRLDNNDLTALDADIFDGLTNLTTIRLDNNDLTALDADIFDGLTNLGALYLNDNDLTALDADIFDGLTKLNTLLFSSNNISALPADLFHPLNDELITLRFSDNLLTTLPDDVFDGLTGLDELDIKCNVLTELDLGLFDPLTTTLASLDIRRNNFTTPPTNTAIRAKLTNLRELHTGDAAGCRRDPRIIPASLTLAEGGAGMYEVTLGIQPTGDVTVAITSDNADVTASPDSLTFTAANWDTPQTVTVWAALDNDLTDDTAELTHDPSGSDYDLARSTTLAVTVTDDDFCSRTAEVQDAVLAEFPGSTCATITDTHLASLSQLSVTGYSSVGIVPGDFAGLTGLQTLTIRESPSLTTVPANAFSGLTSPNFISLDISNNDLTALPEDVFDGLTNLRILYLGSNGLTTLPEDVFDGLTNLTFLHLDDNDLTALPEDVFDGLTNLRTLYLNDNDLTALDADIFDGLTKLNTLLFSSNNISALPADLFHPLNDELITLRFSDNLLTTLPDDVFDGLTGLDELDIKCNVLTELDLGLFDPLTTTLASLDIRRNNFTTPPTNTAIRAKLTNLRELHTGDAAGCRRDPRIIPASLTLAEGGAGMYEVTLGIQPTGDVTVAITSDNADVTASPDSLTFTAANWDTPQTVTVWAALDNDLTDDTAELTHDPSGSDYDLARSTTLAVTVTDDGRGIVFTPTSLTVEEGDADGESYTVRLATEPSEDVTVTVTGQQGADLALGGLSGTSTLTFTTTDWATAQTVTVKAGQDADGADDSVTLAHAAAGGGYDDVVKDLPVTIMDDDVIEVSLSSLTVSPENIIGFTSDQTEYAVGMANTVTQATIVATPQESDSTVAFNTMDADDMTDGHQVALNPGVNTVTITVTDDQGSSDYTLTIGRGVNDALGWKAVADLDGLKAAGNHNPNGLWGNDTTLWVSDIGDLRVYAYNKDGTRDASKEIVLHSDNSNPADIWSNGAIMWVADSHDDNLYAYRLSDGTRVGARDITLDVENDRQFGIWSDGETMWVGDRADAKLYAYQLSDGTRVVSRDFDPNGLPLAHWSDGVTWWIADFPTRNLIATDRDNGEQDSSKRFATPNSLFVGIWSDGETMWVVDIDQAKVYSYNMPRSDNADLRTLAVDGTEVSGFAFDTTSYTVDVGAAVRQVTVSAEVRQLKASITSITPADADDVAEGHQVEINQAETPVVVTVTSQDGTTKSYTVTVRAPPSIVLSEDPLAVEEGDADGVSYTVKLFSQPTATVTVTVSGHARTDLTLTGLSATNTLTFTTANWDTAQTVTVTAAEDEDTLDENVTLTHLASGGNYGSVSRDLAVTIDDDEIIEIVLSEESRSVAEGASGQTYTIRLSYPPTDFVIVVVSGDTDTDIQIAIGRGFTFTKDNWNIPRTIGFNVREDEDTVDDVVTLRHTATGGEYDGVVKDLPVTIMDDDVIEVLLNSLTVSPRNIDTFTSSRTNYSLGMASTVSQATIVATPKESDSTVTFNTMDANDMTDGHQVDLNPGLNTVIITVTNTDSDSYDYTIEIGRGVTDAYGWKAFDDLDQPRTRGDLGLFGIWGDDTTLWVLRTTPLASPLGYARRSIRTENQTRSTFFNLSSENFDSTGMWANDVTMWIADSVDDKLYAYVFPSGRRDGSKDITLDAENDDPTGLWSDGETIWVADSVDNKLYAYELSGGARDDSKDFDVGASPQGHWSDGITWWVAGDGGVFAWERDSGMRDTDKDVATMGAGNVAPKGIWSDGEIMWVVDSAKGKAFSYNMSPSSNADLSSLAVDGVEVSDFDFDTTSYFVDVGSAVREVTVSAEVRQFKASITSITPADFDLQAEGHQVDVTMGVNPVVVTVAAADGTTKSYTVTVRNQSPVLSEDSLALSEGDTDGVSYMVQLPFQPTTAVTVTITGYTGTDLSLDRTSLTFTTEDWNTPQTVTVTAADDTDSMDDAANLTHSVTGGGYDNARTVLPVLVSDSEISLDSLTVSPRNIIGFVPQQRLYAVGMASTVTQATIAALPSKSSSSVTFDSLDADNLEPGHQVNLTTGANLVIITVTAEDGNSSANYFILISRGVNDAFGWKAVADLDGLKAAGNHNPIGLWGNDTTLWVSDLRDLRVYAYNRDGTRDASKEIALHSENSAPADIWSNGAIMWVADLHDDILYAYRLSDGTRVGARDITLDVENDRQFGIWSDGETMWVGDRNDAKLYAYQLSDGTRVVSRDFDPNGNPLGHWSDGVTWWISDSPTLDLIATARDSGEQDSSKHFATLAGANNRFQAGVWSDGETMWVVDIDQAKVYSYNMPPSSNADLSTLAVDGAEVSGFDFDTTSYVVDVGAAVRQVTVSAEVRQLKAGITGITPADANATIDGHQLDVNEGENSLVVTATAQDGTTKSYTITMQGSGVVLSESPLVVPEGNAAGNSYTVKLSHVPTGAVTVTITGHTGTDLALDKTSLTFTTANWSIEQTVTVTAAADADAVDDAATLTHTASGGGFDDRSIDLAVRVEDDEKAKLDALTVGPRDIIGFTQDRIEYAVSMASTATRATIVATPIVSASAVTFSSTDADGVADGHQVDLSPGVNTVTITVTSQNGNVSRQYTVAIARGVTDAFGWKAVEDLDGLKAAGNDNPFAVWGDDTTLWLSDLHDPRVYAYNRDGTRDASKEIALHSDNSNPTGIWSNGAIMWVADSDDDKLYAYQLSDGMRLDSRDITLDAENDDPTGIWSDGETMWVADSDDNKLYAYLLLNGMPESSRDFGVGTAPQGHWSDDATWWIAGTGGVFAWDRVTALMDNSKHLATVSAGNQTPRGVWSDSETMWVVDETNAKVYSYNMPLSSNADLRTLAVDGAEVSSFDVNTTSYVVDVGTAVQQVTISAEARQLKASITSITPADADENVDGHQVNINKTETPVVVTVTAQDGTTKSYTVTVRSPSIVLSKESLTVVEGATTAVGYGVRLSRPPPSPVSVMITGHTSTGLSLNTERLVFTTANWNIYQIVRVTAAEDEDSMDDAVTLRHTASGGSYKLEDIPVKVVDNDRLVVLSALTVSPRDIIGFTPDQRDYAVGMASTVTQATIVATRHSDFSTVTFDSTDADEVAEGHQVDLTSGVNTVTITVTSQDGNYSRDYTLTIGKGVTDAFGWKAVDDLDGLSAAGHGNPFGVWGDGTTLWVGDLNNLLVYAYNTDGTRDTSRGIPLHKNNNGPIGIWSDGETMWVADRRDNALYAYRLSDGMRAGSRDFFLAIENGTPRDIWSDGETMWVASQDTQLYAYRLSNGARISSRDFDTEKFHYGQWSDGVTWWVSDVVSRRVIAVDRDSGMRDTDKDFPTPGGADDTTPWAIWSDGETMWVVPSDEAKVYSYNMPRSGNADLRTLAVDGTEVSGFAFDTTSYAVDVGAAVREVTISAEVRQLKASITSITPADTDDVAEGHQVEINQAETPVVVTVTAQDGTTKSYTVTVRGPSIVLSEEPLAVEEGDADGETYTVKLSSQPTATVTVTVSGQSGTDLTLTGLSSANTLTFTTSNWNTAQTVTVKAGQDDDGADDKITLTHAASGGGFYGVASLEVTVEDDDRAIVFAPTSLTVAEGDADGESYTVKLATQPSAEVTVTVSGQSGTDLTLTGLSSTNTLTFTTSNWDTAQTVTVKAGQDDDGADDEVTLTHTAAGGNYAGAAADLPVTVADNDRGIVFSPTSLTVAEGDADGESYTVKLATQPSAEVTVTVSGQASTDLTLTGLSSTNTLTFTTSNWDTAQTVTVKAGQDDDGADDEVTLTHTAAGGNYAAVAADLPVTVTDNDRGIVFSPTSLTVAEGDADGESYTVKLATQPSAEVTVTVSGQASTDLTLTGLSSTNTLTFTTSNWDTAQTVTVNAGQDDDGSDDEVTLTHTAAGGNYAGAVSELPVTVADNDRGIVFSPTSLTVEEGDADGESYTVKLATQPSAEVTVTVSGQASTDLTLTGLSSTNTLTFTTSNWDTAQTVTVKAGQDDDGADDEVTLTHTAGGGNYAAVAADLAVTVADNDRGIVFSPTSLTVAEGDADGESYTVKLATQPSAEVTVTVSGQSGTDLTLTGLSSTNTLTFTTSNWDTAQTVTVNAGQDDDGADDEVTLTHTAGGGNYAAVAADLPVTVADNDRGIVFSPTSLTVAEGDADGESYTVKLATQPSAEVTVTVSGQSGTDLTLTGLSSTNTLTFTTSNWDTAQTVTVNAGQDDDGADDEVTLTHTAGGGNYAAVAADLPVTVADNDRGIVFSPTSLTVAEGDADGESYTVKLATQPSAEVTVTVSGQSGTDLTLTGLSSTNTLTFTTSNWDTAQTVTVNAGQDDDGADDEVTLTHTAGGGNYAAVAADLPVTVADNDRGIVFSPTSLTVEEGDADGESYTVKLATQPSAEVTVTVSGQSGTDLTVTGLSSTSTLTFTTSNWDTAQTVTVKAGQDDDGADDEVTLTHTAAGGNYAGVAADLAVTVADNDRGIVFSPTSLTVEEGDADGESYTVKLATQPSAEVTVTVSGQSGTDLTVTGLSSTNTLTFTTSNWDTAQTVTVNAGQDDDGADDEVTLTHTAGGGNYAAVAADLPVTVADNDRGIVFSPTSLTVAEGDADGESYTVKLATQPSAEVTVTVSGQSGTDLTLTGLSSTNTLTFTTSNWDTAQTVTVNAGQDDDGADDEVTLTHTAGGGNYAAVAADLPVTVADNDRGIVFSPTSLTVAEGDADGESYTVKLATQPSAEVTVTVSGQASTDLTLTGLSSTNTLTFTTSNWNTAQTVTVKAGQDDDGADDEVTLTHTAAGGNYAAVAADLPVTVADNDRGIVFSPTSLTVAEGDADGESYTVKLATQPSAEVTVTVSGQSGTDLTLTGLSSTNTLTFTTSNWNTAQTVTVKAGQDDDGADDEVTLTHTAGGGNYAGVAADLAVTVADNDRGIVFSPTSLTVEEGDADGESYTVKLATQPSAEVTVTVSGQSGTDLTVTGLSSTSTLTFTTSNWDTAQTVTVKAGQDDDGADDEVTLTHTAAGGNYAAVAADLPVTVADNDRGIVFSPTSLTVEEGDADGESYTVKLATQPSAEVTVTVSGQSGTDLTVTGLSSTSTLTFTTSNWDTAQTVTVKAGQDDDGADDEVTLTHTAAGGNYAGVAADLAVTVADNDRGIVFSPTSLTVEEGDADGESYTVKLATQPSAEVTVTVSGQSGTDLTVTGLSSTNTLTFTTSNWDTAQTVTVNAGQDDDGADDEVTLTHTAGGGNYAAVAADLPVTVADNDRGIVFSPTSLTVEEGDADGESYTVKLATQPSAEVTVTVSGQSGTDLTVTGLSSTNTLTFTTSNWDTAQTVTVNAGQDDDGADDEVTLTHTAGGGNYAAVAADLPVTVADNDRGIVFSPTSLTVAEGDADGESYTVKLATQPSAEVTVTVSGQSGTDLTLTGLSSTNTLTFTTSNWDTAQTVTVNAGQDDDGADDEVTLTHTAGGGNYAAVAADLPVTVADNDRGIVFSPTSLTVAEGDADGESYTVKLATQPSAEVTVTVSGQSGTDLTLTGLSSTNTLTFTTSNWDTAQTVTVNAGQDDDGADDEVTLTHTAGGGNYAAVAADLAVTVADNDRGIVFSPTSLTVAEGDADGESYTVKLATQPSAEVTVTVSGQSGTDLTLTGLSSTSTLTFTTSNWDTAQTVTVNAGQDADGADDEVTLTHTAGGGNYAAVAADLPVTVADNDRGIVFSPTSLTVAEGDADGESYTVKLATQPSAEVTVTVSGQSGTDLTLTGLSSTNTLTFTTSNWDTAQTVTVNAGQDDDGADDEVTLTHTAAGGNYAGAVSELPVTVADNDRGIVFSPTSLTVEEGDADGESYTVKLATEPSAEVTVTVSGQSGTDLTLTGLSSTNTLTFTTANWDTAQTVTVKAAQDADGADDKVTLTHTAAGGDYEGVSAGLEVTVTEVTVTLMNVNEPMNSCDENAVWCATIYLEGWNTDPPYDVYHETGWGNGTTGWDEVDRLFTYGGITYAVQGLRLDPDPRPNAAYNSTFRLSFNYYGSDPRLRSPPSEDHVAQWRLHVGDIQLDFGDARRLGDTSYIWRGAKFRPLSRAGTTVDLRIERIVGEDDIHHYTPVTPNSRPTGELVVTGAPRAGNTLAMDASGISDPEGMVDSDIRYFWWVVYAQYSSEIAKGATYIVEPRYEGLPIFAQITFTDDAGRREHVNSARTERVCAEGGKIEPCQDDVLENAGNAPIENTAAAGEPSISGTPAVGEILTADTSGIEDVNGLTNADFAFQWSRYDGSVSADIAGATGSSYTVTDDDVGYEIEVKVSFTDDAGFEETVTSDTVYLQPPQPLYGALRDGPENHDGSSAFTVELRFSDEVSLEFAAVRDHVLDITGGAVTALQHADPDSERPNLRWQITITPSGDDAVNIVLPPTTDCTDAGAVCTDNGKMLSTRLELVIPGPSSEQSSEENSAATGLPAITGTAQVGETLTADTSSIDDADGLDNAAFSYQWLADDSDISGATGPSYTLADGDGGKAIRVRVAFTDDAGNAESLTSAATDAAEPAAPPAPQDLTAVVKQDGSITLTWTAPDDDSVTGYQILRRRPNQDETTLRVYVDDTGSTSTTYTDTNTPNGHIYVYRVKALNSGGTGDWSNFVRIVKSN